VLFRKLLKTRQRWRNRVVGSERRDGQAVAVQAGLYGVGDPPQASIGSLWRTAIKHYVGRDVALKKTVICVVDDGRRIVREGRAASELEAIVAFLSATGLSLERVGIEAVGALAVRGPGRGGPAGDRHRRPAHEGGGESQAGQDRPDRRPQHRVRDAGGLVPAGASETPGGEEAAAAPVQSADPAAHADRPRPSHPWRALEAFRLKVGKVAAAQFEARVWELIDECDAQVRWIVGTVLTTRAAMMSQLALLHRAMLAVTRQDQLCRRR
jgi:transposase